MCRLAKFAPLFSSWLLAAGLLSCSRSQFASFAFRDTVDVVPAGWQGPVFKLSHHYPGSELGRCPPAVCRWLSIDVDFAAPHPTWPYWQSYGQSLLSYIREGQDPDLREWKIKVGDETRWFHMPWMAVDPTRGREFIHGMTNERTAYDTDFNSDRGGLHSFSLASGTNQLPLAGGHETVKRYETWAFAVFNPWGAYTIGRTWPRSGKPSLTEGRPSGLPFPAGTLVTKLLFSTAQPCDVPYLRGAPVWIVNGHERLDGCKRMPQEVRLVQLDVAVVDPRAPLGWVFATFAYADDPSRPDGSPWDRLQLVGLQWGNDPQRFPAVPRDNQGQGAETATPRESVLAPDLRVHEHYGCGGRLAGPVDNCLSSCTSCHGGSYTGPVGMKPTPEATPAIFGFPQMCTQVTKLNVAYFQDTPYPQPYPAEGYSKAISLDFSLQLQVAFAEYGYYHQDGRPPKCVPRTPPPIDPVCPR